MKFEKTSEEWFDELYPDKRIEITDPKGWDKLNFSHSWYHEKITEQEFNMRVLLSEVSYDKKS